MGISKCPRVVFCGNCLFDWSNNWVHSNYNLHLSLGSILAVLSIKWVDGHHQSRSGNVIKGTSFQCLLDDLAAVAMPSKVRRKLLKSITDSRKLNLMKFNFNKLLLLDFYELLHAIKLIVLWSIKRFTVFYANLLKKREEVTAWEFIEMFWFSINQLDSLGYTNNFIYL